MVHRNVEMEARLIDDLLDLTRISRGKLELHRDLADAHAKIRAVVAGLYGPAVAGALRIQYGGSVKGNNAAELMAQPDIDGALVGGASLKAEDFSKIVKGALR